jgi:hypothetical protein
VLARSHDRASDTLSRRGPGTKKALWAFFVSHIAIQPALESQPLNSPSEQRPPDLDTNRRARTAVSREEENPPSPF